GRTVSRSRGRPHPATVLLDDPPTNREPQAGARSQRFAERVRDSFRSQVPDSPREPVPRAVGSWGRVVDATPLMNRRARQQGPVTGTQPHGDRAHFVEVVVNLAVDLSIPEVVGGEGPEEV